MASKLEHNYGGMLAGTALECLTKGTLPPGQAVLETIGAAWGGHVGSRIPDTVNPPVGFNHWGFAHSYTAGAGTIAVSAPNVWQVRDQLRQAGNDLLAMSYEYGDTPLLQLLAALGAAFMHLMAGFVVGLPAGYVSHLVLDQLVCKGNLPVVKKGF